ncbi:MAG TPA: cysteine desulfurase family protein [Rubrobacteraceae bacterium]|nr:cysteine desulfurase family protein [Rubrobacteraceae bacterium]
MSNPVYLDNAATTPLDSRVLEAMLPHLQGRRGNASSLHASGAAALDAVEEARGSVAAFLGAVPDEVVFTGGGTEADNIAVLGLAAVNPEKRHLAVSRIEHPAVRLAAEHLERRGYEVSWVDVDENGLVDPERFAAALRPDTALAAVMWANNEVGTVQPIEELAVICEERGVPLHVDAVQSAGRIAVNVSSIPISTLAISGHKLYGPQGVGALYVRQGVRVAPTVFGGGQEHGVRSGTHNVSGIAGLGEAARLAAEELDERVAHEKSLRDRILAGVESIPGVRLNGHARQRLSNNAHLFVEGVEAEGLVLLCDALGFEIGSGSACASGGHKASPVLLAMGFGEQEAFSVVRVTVGKDNTAQEIDGFIEAFATAVARLRELSPLYAG